VPAFRSSYSIAAPLLRISKSGTKHGPENGAAIFRKDHAQSKHSSAMTIQRNFIALQQINDSSAAFLFEIPESNLSLVVQEFQIGGTSASLAVLVVVVWSTKQIHDR
jgi:hypothetical protein